MRRLFIYGLLLFSVLSFAQAKKGKDKNLAKGNSEFMDNDYIDAEANYRISQSKSPTQATATYNMGNAIYRMNHNVEAAYAYGLAIKNATTKQQKHMAYHNFGNVLMKDKDYQGAVEAYKNALRNDPTDDQSRYNLALAKEMLKKNPPPPPPKNDKNKDKNDKNKDNKSQQPNNGGGKDDKNQPPKDKGDNKDKGDGKNDQKDKGDKGDNKDKGDKGDQKDKDKGDQGDNKDQGNQKGGQPKPEPGQSPSKQRMENLLDAMNNEEKKVQDKVQARKVKVRTTKQEKDW